MSEVSRGLVLGHDIEAGEGMNASVDQRLQNSEDVSK